MRRRCEGRESNGVALWMCHWQEEMGMRIYEERALKHRERPHILHQEVSGTSA